MQQMNRAVRLPETGIAPEALDAQLAALQAGDADWRGGQVPLYVFLGSQAAADAGRSAFNRFFSENALGAARAFPSLRRLEDEVVAIGLDLMRAPQQATGHMTSGGSESIFLAVRAARDAARARRGRRPGNLVLPVSAHPAFAKAADAMDLEERRIPVDSDWRSDVAAMREAVDDDTVMLVGSVPCFPFGVIDRIDELGELALERGTWLHVDACVGGYLAPFVRELGVPLPAWDFGVPGVSSISADLHKFGFCPKPASTIFYRSAERARFGVFDLDVWPSGRFTTATLVGTRPGGAVAGAWATLHALGRAGYREIARAMLQMRDAYRDDLAARAGWRVLGEPHLTLMGFVHDRADVAQVAQGMAARGWVPGRLREPPGLHLMLSMLHAPARERYVSDLALATQDALAAPAAAGGAPEVRY
jgi:sphinganine-1-phosphate aldolase